LEDTESVQESIQGLLYIASKRLNKTIAQLASKVQLVKFIKLPINNLKKQLNIC
jgi:hypothetical protein